MYITQLQERGRTGVRQDRREAGQERGRTGVRQDRREVGEILNVNLYCLAGGSQLFKGFPPCYIVVTSKNKHKAN